MVHKSNSPPDLDKYFKGKRHNFVTYEDGARLYSIPYWSFVNSVKEAGANRMIRQRVLVDQDIYEKFIEDNCRYEETVKENKEMPKRRIVPNLEEMVKKGKKKYVRYQEGAELYSMGLHTFEKLAKDARATRKVRGVVLCNTEKIDEFIESCWEEDDFYE